MTWGSCWSGGRALLVLGVGLQEDGAAMLFISVGVSSRVCILGEALGFF